jgi:hypothetical protein
MGPVFLLHMGIVLAVVSPASGELGGALSLGEMSDGMMIQELAAIVAIEPEQSKGQHCFDVFELLHDTMLCSAPDGPLFRPAGCNIKAIEGIGEQAHHGLPAVCHRIGFNKAI